MEAEAEIAEKDFNRLVTIYHTWWCKKCQSVVLRLPEIKGVKLPISNMTCRCKNPRKDDRIRAVVTILVDANDL